MNDTWILVIAIGTAVVLIFVIPLMTIADRNDDTAQMVVQTALTEWGDKIATTGKITQADANVFIEKATSTRNMVAYDLQIKATDSNLSAKAALTQRDKTGENASYYIYNSQIEEAWEKNGEYICNPGEEIKLTAYKTNKSPGEELHSAFLPTTGSDDYQRIAEYTTTVKK